MIHLRLFGTVALFDDSGTGREELLAQQKRAALLAYLAVGRPRGPHSRDALTALFWPDLAGKRARSALNQALYYLRNAVGNEAIYSRASEHVQLACDQIDCDVTAFETHLLNGQLKEAVALYDGPFMNGFFLSGLEEFERWVEVERSRLADAATRAVWQLADNAAARGDAAEAINYARRGIELSHDEASVRKLIEIRDRFGDRVGAIREYDRFARQIAKELEAEPSPETQDLVRQIRSRTSSSATPRLPQPAVDESAPPLPQASSHPMSVEPVIDALPEAFVISPNGRSSFRALFSRPVVRIASVVVPVVLLTLLFADFAAWMKPQQTDETRVAIFPFFFTGDARRASSSDAVASLLDAEINAAGKMKTIDWRTIAETHRLGDRKLSPEKGALLARRHDAELFVVGSVNEAVGRYRITGSLYSAFDPATPEVTAIVECDSASLFEAVDSLALRLFSPRLRKPTTRTVEAVESTGR